MNGFAGQLSRLVAPLFRSHAHEIKPQTGVLYVIQATDVMPPDAVQAAIIKVNRALQDAGIEDVPVLILNGNMKLERLSERALESVGLRRLAS